MSEAPILPKSVLAPQAGPQNWLLSCPIFEILYGGGAGAGSTFILLLSWLAHSSQHGERARGTIFRRTNDELDEVIFLSRKIFSPFAKYIPHRRHWVFSNGSIFSMRYLVHGDNVDKFMNQEYSWIGIDKVTDWPVETPVIKLRATLLSSPNPLPKQFLCTGRTGGKGHNWVKARFVDPAPEGMTPLHDPQSDTMRVWIPATIENNPIINEVDPTYINRLRDQFPEWLVDKMLTGDWDLSGYEDELSDVPEFGEWLKIVTPAFKWDWPHLLLIRKRVGQIFDGSLKKLMVFMPPRHGKSNAITIRFPAWYLEKRPEDRVIVGAYNQTLANKFSRQTRKIATERLALSKERTAVEDWETEAGGGLRAVGVGGGITGQGGNLIIIDDPVKNREEANSQAYRDKVWDWYTDDLSTRMEPGAAIILIMTRWHQDDLAGRILASEDGPNWTVINLPALAEIGEDGELDELGRKEGEALCPERYDVKALLDIKRVLGASFQSLYQQRPSAVEGEIWKREWWKYYKQLPPGPCLTLHSWDTAFKAKQRNDPWGCVILKVYKTGIYVTFRLNQKMETPDGKRAIRNVNAMDPANVILIEDKASGQNIVQELRRDTTLPIIAFNIGTNDKEERARLATPTVEAGQVFLPEDAPWLVEFIDQMATFPNGKHDEDSDIIAQAIIWIQQQQKPRSYSTHVNFMGR
jgi:predicted phage terminase large subunit-like protein